jgi:REP element-mobilizing transposase RayT
MARPLRIQYPGAVYHITCRGNDRKNIFRDNLDRKKMLEILVHSLMVYKVKLFSYVFMDNHFHLLVETPLGNLSEFMRQFNITYTGYYNRRHKHIGHLYQGRYKSILVDKEAYLAVLSRYIHLNPVKVKGTLKLPIEERIKKLKGYQWSSLHGYININKRLSYIDYGMVLGEYGGDTEMAGKKYKDLLYIELSKDVDIKDKIIGQSIIGRAEFIEGVREKFIDKDNIREIPAVKEIHRYRSEKEIISAIKKETGKGLNELRQDKGIYRQITMDLLYRHGGMKGEEIGKIFGVGYTSVSQERRRLANKVQEDRKIRDLVIRIEGLCQ